MATHPGLWLPACFCVAWSVGFGWCKPLDVPVPAEGGDGPVGEGEAQLGMGAYTDAVQKKLLDVSALPPARAKVDLPPFMLELYNRYAADKSSSPQSDVVRSFSLQEVVLSESSGAQSVFRLLFNISIPCHEEVTIAELHLFTKVDRTSVACNKTLATVRVYNVEQGEGATRLEFLSSSDIGGAYNSWKAFDVTGGRSTWISSGRGIACEFEVHVELYSCELWAPQPVNVSVSLGDDNTSAVLIIFSNDLRDREKNPPDQDEDVGDYNEIPGFVLLRHRRHTTRRGLASA